MPGRYRHHARRFSLPAWLPGLVLGFAAGVLVTWALFPRATAAQVIPTGGPAASPRPGSAATAAPAPTASPEPAKAASEHPWYLTLVNFETPIDPELEVPLSTLEGSTQRFDSRAISALEDMLAAMEAEGLSPAVCSGYRTRETQETLYARQVDFWLSMGYSQADAEAEACLMVARPDTSEHQLGLAADIVAADYQVLDASQENTPEQQWLLAHCQEYGFILRYPSGKTDRTGVSYEPWHYRYVGKAAAEAIMAQGLCLEEYLESLEN